jgi:hypothetical protein
VGVTRFEEALVVVEVRDPVGVTEVMTMILGCSPDRVPEGMTVMIELATPVGLGVSRGGMDMIPETVDREGSVITETTVPETGGTLVTLPVRPMRVSITALKIETKVVVAYMMRVSCMAASNSPQSMPMDRKQME